MSTNFQINALPIEQFSPLFELNEEELQRRSARWLIADSNPGFPCRVTLEDAEVGERVLALSFTHHEVPSPYAASGAIFVRETAATARLEVNEVPKMLLHRLLSLRAYDSKGMMIGAKVVEGPDLEQAIGAHFANGDVVYQHIHNANPGCFNCEVRRA